MKNSALLSACALFLLLAGGAVYVAAGLSDGDDGKPAIVFSGGHETDARDGGRPVVLVAAALGVKSDVFRDAFSGVRPAKDGKPTKEQAQQNKQVLMKVLAPHGVTGDRLDEVSNYYRYKAGKGNLWRTSPAKAYAILEDGKVKRIVITDAGSGYSSSPKATIAGLDKVKLKVAIQFSKDFKDNGAVKSIEIE